MSFQCDLCPKKFRAYCSLRWHKSKFHEVKNVCETCGDTFTSRGSLYYHRKRKHSPSERTIDTSGAKCGKCNAQLKSTILLCSHLNLVHRMDIRILHLDFDNRAQFEKWRIDVENRGHFKFVSIRGATKIDNMKTEYLYCHRSGPYVSKSEGIRPPKPLPSHKINFNCSAFAKIRTDLSTERISVKTCLDHYGHDDLPVKLSKSEELRRRSSRFLNKERDCDYALRHFYDDPENDLDYNATEFYSSSALNTVDLNYIQSQRGTLKWVHKSSNDMCSVYMWVKELEADQSLFCYSPQDGSGTFTLGVQTAFQLEVLKKYGPTAICLESTQGTNFYGFSLVTLMVMDDFGMGLPVAWLITESEDESQLANFFMALREKMGAFRTKFFLSADVPAYFNAWSFAFDTSETQQILCMRQVVRDWQMNAKLKIANEKNRSAILSQLELLIKEQKESDFRLVLDSFMSVLEATEPEFGRYFRDQFCPESRLAQWTAWSLKNSPVQTNLHIDRFHKQLKSAYLNGKQNNRLDFLAVVLFCAARDYLRDTIIKLHSSVGGSAAANFRISLLLDRHRAAGDMNQNQLIIVEPEKSWKIKSTIGATGESIEYTIRKVSDTCSCKLACQLCNACPHMYDCSCPDSIIRVGACKHVHFVHNRPKSGSGKMGSAPIYAIILPPQHQSQPPHRFTHGSATAYSVLQTSVKTEPVTDMIVEPVDPTEPEPVYIEEPVYHSMDDSSSASGYKRIFAASGSRKSGNGRNQLIAQADGIWTNVKVVGGSGTLDPHVARQVYRKMQEIGRLCKSEIEEEDDEEEEEEELGMVPKPRITGHSVQQQRRNVVAEVSAESSFMDAEAEESGQPQTPPPSSSSYERMQTRSRSRRTPLKSNEPQTRFVVARRGRRARSSTSNDEDTVVADEYNETTISPKKFGLRPRRKRGETVEETS